MAPTNRLAPLLRPLLLTVMLCALLLALAPPGADAAKARISGHLPNCHVAVAAASSAPRTAPTIRPARGASHMCRAKAGTTLMNSKSSACRWDKIE